MDIESLLSEYSNLPEFSGRTISCVHQRGGWDSRPLHIAIYRCSKQEVTILLAAGADPNAKGEYGERPLQVAINCGEKEIMELFPERILAGPADGRHAVVNDDRSLALGRVFLGKEASFEKFCADGA